MKFIYNNTKYEIAIDDFISVYHLQTIIKKKYGFIIDESYSITDLEGLIYKPAGTVIKNNETVIIKKKLRGGQEFNPYDSDISGGKMNSVAFITAIVSGFYYFKYISGLVVETNTEYLIFQKAKNIETYGKKGGGGEEHTNNTTPIISMNNINNQKPSAFKQFLISFKEGLQDSKFKKVDCAFDRLFPDQELNRDYDNYSNWNMIATSAIFMTYFLTVLIALFINPTSTSYCGTPNRGIGVLTFVMLLIPLALIYVVPYLVKGIDILLTKINLSSYAGFSNYKLATSNILLIVMLIVFCFINIKGISPMFGAMIPVFMFVFAMIDFILKKTEILRILSRFFGNLITNTEKIPNDNEDMFNTHVNMIKPSHRNGQTDNLPAPECYYRFNIFHSLFYGVITSLIGRGFFSSVYSANIKYCCPK
jgi:hypothetical protein